MTTLNALSTATTSTFLTDLPSELLTKVIQSLVSMDNLDEFPQSIYALSPLAQTNNLLRNLAAPVRNEVCAKALKQGVLEAHPRRTAAEIYYKLPHMRLSQYIPAYEGIPENILNIINRDTSNNYNYQQWQTELQSTLAAGPDASLGYPHPFYHFSLYSAAKLVQCVAVKLLLNMYDPATVPQTISANSDEALACAAGKGHHDVVRLLLNYYPPTTVLEGLGKAFCEAAVGGHTKVLQLIYNTFGSATTSELLAQNDCAFYRFPVRFDHAPIRIAKHFGNKEAVLLLLSFYAKSHYSANNYIHLNKQQEHF